MATSNWGLFHTGPSIVPPTSAPALLPSWFSSSNSTSTVRPASPSVTLSLFPVTVSASPLIPWLQVEKGLDNVNPPLVLGSLPPNGSVPACGDGSVLISELVECCKLLEEGHRAWAAQKKEAAWRLRRIEMQLESEKSCRIREKMEEIESKVKALREEQEAFLDRIEAKYKDQLAELRKDAEAKEQKLADQWATKHKHLTMFIDQMVRRSRLPEPNSR